MVLLTEGNSMADGHGHCHPPLNEKEYEEESRCGWWSFRPETLQKLNSPKCVLFCLCVASCLQGLIVNGFVNVVITSIERRFEIKSTDSGVIAGSYDVGTLICLVPVTYFGGHASKPLLVGIGVIIAGLGSFTFSLPHFTTDSYTFRVESPAVCRPENLTTCTTHTSSNAGVASLSSYRYVFFLGQFLHGIGYSPLYTLGVTYLDESVSTKMSSVYLGIFYTTSVIGPAIGYVVGGQLLKIYTDFTSYDPRQLGLSASSNLWVGAWWLGFIVVSGLAIIVGVPLTLFPKELPGTRKIRMNKISETHQKTQNSAATHSGFGIRFKDLPKSLRILLMNPTFVFISFAGALDAFLVAALSTFLPKYIESQFNLMSSWSAFLMGLVTVLGAGFGMIVGGVTVKKYNLKCRGMLKFCFAGSVIALCLMVVFAVRCEDPSFAGVNVPYRVKTDGMKCHSRCNCDLSSYDPVCGTDDVMYYSPCFAGCTTTVFTPTSKVYENCSCISGRGKTIEVNGQDVAYHAIREKCPSRCNLLAAFLAIVFLAMFFTFVIVTPSLQITLRCVAESQRSFALGVQWICVRVLGSIPGPIVVGSLIDRSCNLWQQTCDGSYGSCRSYDNYVLSLTLAAVAVTVKLSSSVMFGLALCTYKPPNDNSSAVPDQQDGRVTPSSHITTVSEKVKRNYEPVNGLTFNVLPPD